MSLLGLVDLWWSQPWAFAARPRQLQAIPQHAPRKPGDRLSVTYRVLINR